MTRSMIPHSEGSSDEGPGGHGAGGHGTGGDWPLEGWTAIGPYGSDRALRDAALVLSAMSIQHTVLRGVGGGYLVVRDVDYKSARKNLDRYEEENRDFPPRRVVERSRYAGFSVVALAFALMVAFSFVTGPVAKPLGAWFQEGASVSQLLAQQPFRAVTALTLHADGAHVLSNLVSGAIFGRALERRSGPGLALLGFVVSGTLGNVVNAAFYASEGLGHSSIGASTGVFGIIGLLATTQLFASARRSAPDSAGKAAKPHFTVYLAPFVGGLGLLGALGSGQQTDVFAHAFGLLAGFVVGLPLALLLRAQPRLSRLTEVGAGALALAIVGASWGAALLV